MEQHASQANVEFWFRQIYELWARLLHLDPSTLAALAAKWWLIISLVGYVLALVGLFVLVYSTVRLHELRQREREKYGTIHLASAEEAANPRWVHIQALMESGNASDWRQAIIEADIMLDDMLTKLRYPGVSIGEKLKAAEISDFSTLQDAWEAHKVRNQIAHEGSAFALSQTLAQRTLAHYETVFREFAII